MKKRTVLVERKQKKYRDGSWTEQLYVGKKLFRVTECTVSGEKCQQFFLKKGRKFFVIHSGSMLEETFYEKNGFRDGIQREYVDGKLMWVTAYRNGKEHGTAKSFYKNGKLQEAALYRNGLCIAELSLKNKKMMDLHGREIKHPTPALKKWQQDLLQKQR